MMHELEASDFDRVDPIFAGRKQYIPARAVIGGHFPGRVFVDEADSPAVAFVWALDRWATIDGDPENEAVAAHLAELVEDLVFPLQRRLGHCWFELYASNAEAWATTIERTLERLQPRRHTETTSHLDVARYAEAERPPLPDGSSLEPADFFIVPEQARSSGLITGILRTRKTFGFQLVACDRVLAVCRSTGFEVGNEFMVDVKTPSQRDRGNGYATLASRALIDYALEKGYAPLWECADDNAPSRRLARKLGFVADETYPVYAMRVPAPQG